jgi:hypothetical protein
MKRTILTIIIATVFGLSYYFIFKLPEKELELPQNNVQTKEENVPVANNLNNNIISEDSENIGDFKGYYVKKIIPGEYQIQEGGDLTDRVFVATTTCDTFVILSGNQPIIDYYKELITSGNGINSLDKNGNLIVNIDIDNLDISKKLTVLNSNQTNPISITLQKNILQGRGAGHCSKSLKAI